MSRFVSGTLDEMGVFDTSFGRIGDTDFDTFSEKVGITVFLGDNIGFEVTFFILFLSFVHNQ